jgi:CDP-diglyceride synthetase
MNPNKTPTPNIAVFWIIWFAIMNGLFIMLFLVAGGIPKGANQGPPPTWIVGACAALVVVAVAIRFLLIPKIKQIAQLLPAMIVGMAFAEAVGIFAIFLLGKEFPETRMSLFLTSAFTVLIYAPSYASNLAKGAVNPKR